MIYLSAAIVVVALFAWLSVRDWIALQRRKHEDTRCRVVSAEEVASLRADIESTKRLLNSLTLKAGISGFGGLK